MTQQEKPQVRFARFVVGLIPDAKFIHDLAVMYVRKYHNYSNIDMYKNGEYRWLKQALTGKSSPVVFDVGANVGHWSKTVLEIVPQATIHAFEPSPTTFKILLSAELSSKVALNNFALGASPSTLTFYEYGDAHAHNSFFPRHDKPHQSTKEIGVETLESYCQKHQIDHIDFLKIDTEGYDFHVLRGAKSLLEAEKIDFIQFEYGDNYIDARIFLKDIFDFVVDLEYDIYRIMPKALKHIPVYHEALEAFSYSNYAIVHKRFAKELV